MAGLPREEEPYSWPTLMANIRRRWWWWLWFPCFQLVVLAFLAAVFDTAAGEAMPSRTSRASCSTREELQKGTLDAYIHAYTCIVVNVRDEREKLRPQSLQKKQKEKKEKEMDKTE